MSKLKKNIILIVVIAGIVGSVLYLESQKVRPGVSKQEGITQCIPGVNGSCTTTTPIAATTTTVNFEKETAQKITSPEIALKTKKYKPYVEIENPSGFINTNGKALSIKELIGKKVVLVDFWTYSCINCQRTLPYLTSWYNKYKDAGLEIVSIHTPEFEFEKKYENVLEASKRFGISYPIVQDNDYGTWHAYNNFYWPRKYLIDIDGFIVYDHIGEGGYAETEQKIQELLAERDNRLGTTNLTSKEIVTPATAEAIDTTKPHTPEIYFGAFRNESLGNGDRGKAGTQTLSFPSVIATHVLYLSGVWNIEKEYAFSESKEARITIRYQAQKAFMVASASSPTVVKVLLDGKPIPLELRGKDMATDGTVTIKEERLYRIVEDIVWGEHTLEFIIEKPGLNAFTFTFG